MSFKNLLLGEERLGHQTALNEQRVLRVVRVSVIACALVTVLLLVAVVYASIQALGAACFAPKFFKCSSNQSLNAFSNPWYYLPTRGKGRCLPWVEDDVCFVPGRSLFRNVSHCKDVCEKRLPRSRCTMPVHRTMVENCANDSVVQEESLFFYDPISHRCHVWENVCLFKTFVSQRSCVELCKRV